jgi:hypothetical protein
MTAHSVASNTWRDAAKTSVVTKAVQRKAPSTETEHYI